MTELALDAEEMAALRDAAKRTGRTETEQAEHWLRLGRLVEGHGLSDRVLSALKAEISPDDLGPEERDGYIDALLETVSTPTPEQVRFFQDRRDRQLGVGLDDNGNLVGLIDADRR